MQSLLPPIDVSFLADALRAVGDELQRAAEDSETPVEPAPDVFLAALQQLVAVLRELDAASSALSPEAGNLGETVSATADASAVLEYGVELLFHLASLARELRLATSAQEIEALVLPLSIWLVRRGAEFARPELVGNAAAALADRLGEPEALAELYSWMSELLEGFAPQINEASDLADPPEAWRLLLINRAIVATRSHQPALMTEAFDALVEFLPSDAPDFFREGMGQMEAVDCPVKVREVMETYFNRWSHQQRLH